MLDTMQATKTTAQSCGGFYVPWQSSFPAVLAALTGDYLVASLLIMTANMIPGSVPRTALQGKISAKPRLPHPRVPETKPSEAGSAR